MASSGGYVLQGSGTAGAQQNGEGSAARITPMLFDIEILMRKTPIVALFRSPTLHVVALVLNGCC